MKSKTVVVRTYRILKWIVVVVVLTFFARAIINIAKETQAQVPQIKLKNTPARKLPQILLHHYQINEMQTRRIHLA